MSKLNITSLKDAFSSFKIAYLELQKKPDDLLVRDAAIHRFKFTYELAVKMIKRQLEMESSVPSDIDPMSFKDRMRYAAEKGLIDDPVQWFEFREKLNITSHTYNNDEADKIVTIFDSFLTAIQPLIGTLASRNAD